MAADHTESDMVVKLMYGSEKRGRQELRVPAQFASPNPNEIRVLSARLGGTFCVNLP